jgi:transcriptional regulator with AAA-type ATPase domain
VARDCGSRHGTYIDGLLATTPLDVGWGAIIRAGGCVFVLVEDMASLAPPGDDDGIALGLAGKFNAGPIIERLRVAGQTGRHVLLEGESGSGKELAASVLHDTWAEQGRLGPFVAHNAACFAGEDDAVGTLLGVRKGAFTGVEPREGALEAASAGTLFLDEVHNLPTRVQRTLLRFLEDGLLRPLGEDSSSKRVDVRLVFGTNLEVVKACDEGLLAHDLVARLHRVKLPPLRERREDIPSIFVYLCRKRLEPNRADALVGCLDSPALEQLCLHDYLRGNVRELEDLGAVAGARIAVGQQPTSALLKAMQESFDLAPRELQPDSPSQGPPSLYDRHRNEIVAAYREVGDNLSKLEKRLRDKGIQCNRRWLGVYLERWGVRSVRRKK